MDATVETLRYVMKQSTVDRWSNPEVILVITDFLEGPSLMLHATSQAKLSGARIILVHVARPSFLRASSDPRNPSSVPSFESQASGTGMDQMVSSAARRGILCEPVLVTGAPVEQIALLVKSRGVDRVIVASRSLRGVERLLVGSIAEELAATLEVPVCMVGQGTHPSPNGCITPPGQILVANSLHRGSSLCTSFASAFAEVHGARLTLLHVLDSGRIDKSQTDEARALARQKLDACIPMQGNEALRPTIEIREGDAATKILDVANSLPYDFIVLGSSPHSAVSRILASRVIHRVVNEAKCPVITIKPMELAERDVMHESFHESQFKFSRKYL